MQASRAPVRVVMTVRPTMAKSLPWIARTPAVTTRTSQFLVPTNVVTSTRRLYAPPLTTAPTLMTPKIWDVEKRVVNGTSQSLLIRLPLISLVLK